MPGFALGLAVLNVVLTTALITRMRGAALEPAPGADPNVPAAGARVGAFELELADGRLFTEAQLKKGDSVVSFFSPDCPVCEVQRSHLFAARRSTWLNVSFIHVWEGNRDRADRLVKTMELLGPAALMTEEVCRVFGVTPEKSGFPTLLRFRDGTVIASGHDVRDILSAGELRS